MENHDQLYQQFRDAADNAIPPQMPNSAAVWDKVSSKLDNRALTRQNRRWKVLSGAAALLLLFTVGIQIYDNNIDKAFVPVEAGINDNKPANDEAMQTTVTAPANEKSTVSGNMPVLQEQAQNANAIAAEEVAEEARQTADKSVRNEMTDRHNADAASKKESKWMGNRKFDAVSVHSPPHKPIRSEAESATASGVVVQRTNGPLVILDGKVVSEANPAYSTLSHAGEQDMDSQMDSIRVLTNPLYIINGQEYSEEELYGKKPTSPYAPLNQQQIESTEVIHGEEAILKYGKKGKDGVVIIKTKNSKPIRK